MEFQGIIEVDVHGLNAEQAVKKVEEKVNQANTTTYRIRVIHGYNRGTRIKDAIYRELGYGLCPKVKKIVPGDNLGITELVLKDYY